MPTPKPLSPEQAKRSLAHRLAFRADRLRQLATRFGIRPYRVFLVYTKASGEEPGTGRTREVYRHELLPTPKYRESLNRVLLSGGIVPMGSVELTEVSAARYTENMLIGRELPEHNEDSVPAPYEFHYEIVEDGRDGSDPKVQRYRVFGCPFRDAGGLQWKYTLSPISEDD